MFPKNMIKFIKTNKSTVFISVLLVVLAGILIWYLLGETNPTDVTTTQKGTKRVFFSTKMSTIKASPSSQNGFGSSTKTATTETTTTTTTTTLTTGSPSPQNGFGSSTKTATTTTTTTGQGTTALTTGYSKVLVATGYGYIYNVEIIDLLSPDSTCNNQADFPYANFYSIGGLAFDGSPIVCGGVINKEACQVYKGGSWQNSYILNDGGKQVSAVTNSPFLDGKSTLFLTGGHNGSVASSSSYILTENGWQKSVTLPTSIFYHCMATVNLTSVIVIGGFQNIVGGSYIFNSVTNLWSQGPSLKMLRYGHSCGLTYKNNLSDEMSLVAVGGLFNDSYVLSSVEVLDLDSNSWREGPGLPIPIAGGTIVQDPYGAVFLIGGQNLVQAGLNTIFKLSNAESNWEKMVKTLQTGRSFFVAFLVPSTLANCKYPGGTSPKIEKPARQTTTTTTTGTSAIESVSTHQTTSINLDDVKGYSKAIVGLGNNKNDVEIVDLFSSETICQKPLQFPYGNSYSAGGLSFQNKPLLCGGIVNSKQCFIYDDGNWKSSYNLNLGRAYFTITMSPFVDGESKLFVIGGKVDSVSTSSTEILTENGWQYSVPLPVTIFYHCSVLFNVTSVMVIGGYTSGISGKTYIFNSETNIWTVGPNLITRRSGHSCGLVNKNNQTLEKSLVVAGGSLNASLLLASSEFLDLDSDIWRQGPTLPFTMSFSVMVEDPFGAVVLIGGFSYTVGFLGTLYKLQNAGQGATWTKMTQTLKTARALPTVILVPDMFANCTKLVGRISVALGSEGLPTMKDIEVVDISLSNTTCQNLPDFPYTNQRAMGRFGFGDNIIICGGNFQSSACQSFQNGAWKTFGSMNEPRLQFAMTISPFTNDGSKLFVSGGKSVLSKSTEVLTENGWQFSVPTPITIYAHCMVLVNSTSIIVIAGYQNNSIVTTGITYFLNGDTKIWSQGPTLMYQRENPSCAMIKKDSQSDTKSIIVVGGFNGSCMTSTEVLDPLTSIWHSGPVLPYGIAYGSLVEDSLGGVILVGGYNDVKLELNTLYRLVYSALDANWELLPHLLRKARRNLIALMIPEEITNCTIF